MQQDCYRCGDKTRSQLCDELGDYRCFAGEIGLLIEHGTDYFAGTRTFEQIVRDAYSTLQEALAEGYVESDTDDRFTVVTEEEARKIDEALAAGRFRLAEQEKIEQYQEGVDKVLELLGHPEALVTDLSDLFDFEFDFNDHVQCLMRREFGPSIDCNTKIWELGRAIMNRGY